MSILEIDAGNTRLKWRVTKQGDVIARGVVNNTSPEDMVEAIAGEVESTEECWLASVRGAEVIAALSLAIQKRFSVSVQIPKPENGVGGLFVNEVDPARLGMDRWLAMLGARKLYPDQPVMVVDSGTALTLDVVNGAGVFQGGLICPGLKTMLKAMADSADLLVMPPEPVLERGLTFASIQAVQNGALTMAVSLVEREAERFGQNIKVILCGGDGQLLAGNMAIPVQLEPELVFEGLSVALKNAEREE
ncbi:type III pantothenate kinase [Parendozoicomonas haliclonae]|uniref:Type III pantothenate kinase n=1 Tax=Parendozoicomonas haliclonae TaxID=1960125 RepID=A0A1X7AN78_9GAMM|nr:type III pantothenate kinase [Parendozoicomonas haliclonae]SMA49746.1 Type III pantothenate kinase [Parendozoicomonas haliclonae]